MATLTIRFTGICTQFHGVVPGVPLRAVLPNAIGMQLGVVRLPPRDMDTPYYLMPHVAFVTDGQPGGWRQILTGTRLEIVNATVDQPFRFLGGGFRLTEFVHDFAFADDVVFGGNAACYFDISAGTAQSKGGDGNNPKFTEVQMETDGTPLLRFTPFPGSPSIPLKNPHPIDGNELWVTNLDFDAPEEDRPYDFC